MESILDQVEIKTNDLGNLLTTELYHEENDCYEILFPINEFVTYGYSSILSNYGALRLLIEGKGVFYRENSS